MQVAQASWREPAVGLRGGVGYEALAVTPANLRAFGFADLRAGSAFLEECWLTEEMAAGRPKLSGIHAVAADIRRVALADGAREEVERVQSNCPGTIRVFLVPQAIRCGCSTRCRTRTQPERRLVLCLMQTSSHGYLRGALPAGRSCEGGSRSPVSYSFGPTKLDGPIALGEAFDSAAGQLWWIVEFGPYGALADVMEAYEGLPARTFA